MLFRSRNNATVNLIKAFVWPHKGFYRGWIYLMLRILRLKSSNYALAMGFACGVFVSFTPFFGLHFLIAAGLAWLFRANIIIAIIGTFFGNPWTFPFIWFTTYSIGVRLLGTENISGEPNLESLFSDGYNLESLFSGIYNVLMPMFAGSLVLGLPIGVLCFIVGYSSAGKIRAYFSAVVKKRIARIKARRRKNKMNKLNKIRQNKR